MNDTAQAKPKRGSRMETFIGSLLLIGVLTSGAFIVAGWIWQWFATGKWGFDYTLPRTNLLRFVRQELSNVALGNHGPSLLINWGIIFLFLTPYFRVFLSFFYFLLAERNWKYSALTGFVLVALTLSLTVI
jgi:uncharacterized membrane protein